VGPGWAILVAPPTPEGGVAVGGTGNRVEGGGPTTTKVSSELTRVSSELTIPDSLSALSDTSLIPNQRCMIQR
jgi:hypothetical protein